jgi:hypothetical protein
LADWHVDTVTFPLALPDSVFPAEGQTHSGDVGGWHDLRHTLTTGLLQRGVDPKVVSEILGHSHVKITLDIDDQPNIENSRDPLTQMGDQLLPDATQTAAAI